MWPFVWPFTKVTSAAVPLQTNLQSHWEPALREALKLKMTRIRRSSRLTPTGTKSCSLLSSISRSKTTIFSMPRRCRLRSHIVWLRGLSFLKVFLSWRSSAERRTTCHSWRLNALWPRRKWPTTEKTTLEFRSHATTLARIVKSSSINTPMTTLFRIRSSSARIEAMILLSSEIGLKTYFKD